ncbi:hypothetical protein D3C72_1628320 [compost metagenome]
MVQQRPIAFAEVVPGTGQRLLEKPFVFSGAPAGVEVGAVHRVMRHQCLQGPADRAQGQVAGHQVVARHLQQRLGHRLAVAGQAGIEHQVAGLTHFFGEVGAFAHIGPQLGQRCFARRVVLQQRNLVHEFIAGSAVGKPVAVQVLVGAEDLLHVDREMLQGGVQRPPCQQAIDPSAQLAAVAARVGQAVDMVDAQAVYQAALDQLEQLGVGGLEHHRAFHPQAAQLVDVEEAPPVDVVGGGTPAGQTVGLALQ